MAHHRCRQAALLFLVMLAFTTVLSGCQRAKAGARCRTADWGDDGGAWVLQCRKGRWTRALTKADAARLILAAIPSTTQPAPSAPATTAAPVTAPPTSSPPVPTLRAVQIAVAPDHACARIEGGSVWCWGLDSANQVGTGIGTGTMLSIKDTPAAVAGLVDAVDVAVTDGVSCAARSDGTVTCWGDDSSGQYGDGAPFQANLGARVTVPGVAGAQRLVAGGATICAIGADSLLTCWGRELTGRNDPGGSPTDVPAPLAGAGSVVAAAVSTGHGCGVAGSGTVRCWGANPQGQLGSLPTHPDESAPAVVSGISSATAVVTADSASCALAGGDVWCWGGNGRGQLGRGTTSNDPAATPARVVGLTGATQVTGLGDAFCALASGRVRCWGDASSAALNSFGEHVATPSVEDAGFDDAVAVSGAASHVCALTSSGQVWCRGANDVGQLGNGTVHTSGGSWTPVRVSSIG